MTEKTFNNEGDTAMTKKGLTLIFSVLLFSLLISGCKMPASKAPTVEATPTIIRLQTNEPGQSTQIPMDETDTGQANTATPEPGETTMPAQSTNTLAPTEVIPVPTITKPAEYTLKQGEFLYCIARRFDVDPNDLLSTNNLGENDLLSPGDTIQIPQDSAWVGGGRVRNPHPTSHTVTAGETVYSIACYYGDVTPEAIIAVNRLEEPYDLSPGQVLNIP
jgi:LysM repeat protein